MRPHAATRRAIDRLDARPGHRVSRPPRLRSAPSLKRPAHGLGDVTSSQALGTGARGGGGSVRAPRRSRSVHDKTVGTLSATSSIGCQNASQTRTAATEGEGREAQRDRERELRRAVTGVEPARDGRPEPEERQHRHGSRSATARWPICASARTAASAAAAMPEPRRRQGTRPLDGQVEVADARRGLAPERRCGAPLRRLAAKARARGRERADTSRGPCSIPRRLARMSWRGKSSSRPPRRSPDERGQIAKRARDEARSRGIARGLRSTTLV